MGEGEREGVCVLVYWWRLLLLTLQMCTSSLLLSGRVKNVSVRCMIMSRTSSECTMKLNDRQPARREERSEVRAGLQTMMARRAVEGEGY